MTLLRSRSLNLVFLLAITLAVRLFEPVSIYAATPEPTSLPTAPPTATHATSTSVPTATAVYHPPTAKPTNTPIPPAIPTQYFWGAAEATALVTGGNPLAIATPRPSRTPGPSATTAARGQALFGSAWVSPAQETAEAVRLTAVEIRLHPTVTPTLKPVIAEVVNAPTLTTEQALSSSIPSRMRLSGPIDPNDSSDSSTQGRVRAAGLIPPPPIRYAGVPSQSHDAGWLNPTTLWLSVPHRSQFDGTSYGGTNCGPASLGMILEAFGLRGYPTDAIRGEVNRLQGDSNPDNGTSLYAIASVAQRAGLYPMGLSHSWTMAEVRSNLSQGRPVITLTRYADLPGSGGFDLRTNHYIVLSGLSGDQIIYNDPAYAQGTGRGLLIAPDALQRAWANSDVPGQAVAFAIDPSGAGLMSPVAIRMHQAFLDDEDAAVDDELDDADDAGLDDAASAFWRAAIRSIGSRPISDVSIVEVTSDRPAEAFGSGPGDLSSTGGPWSAWPLLGLLLVALLVMWATLTFAFVRLIPAPTE